MLQKQHSVLKRAKEKTVELATKTKALADSTHSNLDRFLESTTPLVPAHYFSKTTMRGSKMCDVEYQPYFTLGDLWGSFEEWSAYGTGVPLVLEGRDDVVQYYVPYLSGIELYGESTLRSNSRRVGEDSDGDSYKGSSSDESSDNEFDKSTKCSRARFHNLTKEVTTGMEGFSSDDSETGNSRGRLMFEYLERDPPYSREPLADKILDLTRLYPRLKTLKSCDVLPISWMSVAWYWKYSSSSYNLPEGDRWCPKDFLAYAWNGFL